VGAVALAAALLAALSTACTGGSEHETTLELWAMGSEGEAAARLVAGFEQENPGVGVRVQAIPWSAAHEKLLTAYVGETMPDVFQLGNTWVPEMVALDAITPLTDRLEASERVARDDFFEGILDTNVIDGAVYALPWYVDTRLLFYRRDLLTAAGFATAPRSWDAWLEAMRRIERSAADRYAILLPLGEWEPAVIFAMQLGAELLRDGDRYGNFQSAEFRGGIELYLKMFERGFAPLGEGLAADPYRDFAAGFFCFYLSGPWNLGEFARRLPAVVQQSWATAPLPAPDGDAPGVSLAGGASLAIHRKTEHADAAWRLVEHLSARERQIELYRLTGDLPSRKSAWESAGLRNDARTEAFWRQLQHVRPTPKVPEWERIAAAIGRHAEAAVRGDVGVEVALARLDAEANAILSKRRSLLARQ
jgi:multiple sugar transport system substrate-binding protein